MAARHTHAPRFEERSDRARRAPTLGSEPRPSSGTRWPLVAGLAASIVAAAFVVAWPAVDGDWQWDDDTSVTASVTARGPYSFRDIWIAPTGPDYFPLTTTAFWAEWHLFGRQVRGYHEIGRAHV